MYDRQKPKPSRAPGSHFSAATEGVTDIINLNSSPRRNRSSLYFEKHEKSSYNLPFLLKCLSVFSIISMFMNVYLLFTNLRLPDEADT